MAHQLRSTRLTDGTEVPAGADGTDPEQSGAATVAAPPPPGALDLEVGVSIGTILAGISAGVTVQDKAGRLLYVNDDAARMAGFASPAAMLAASPRELLARYELVDEGGGPFDPAALPGRRVLAGESPEPVLIGFRQLADGAERWSLLLARVALLPDGRVVAVNTFQDVTPRIEAERLVRDRERRFREMAEERRRAEDRLDTVLRRMPIGVILAAADDGRVLFANEAARRLSLGPIRVGEPADFEGVRWLRNDGTELPRHDWPLVRALRGDTVVGEVVTVEPGVGERRTYSMSSAPILDRSKRIESAIVTLSDLTERVRAERREQFLARASAVLASSLDYEQTVQTVADLAVPDFADWCVVQLADEEGSPRQIAVAHRDPDMVAMALQTQRDYPPDPEATTGIAAILRTGRAEYVADIPPEVVDAAARDDRHRELLRALSLRSYISVPLAAAGRILGVLTLVGSESSRRFEPDDVTFAENLATRAAAAIENARLFRDGVRFKRLLDATSDAVLLVDPDDDRIVYANRGAADQFGRTAEALAGTAIGDHLDGADLATIRDAVDALADDAADVRTETVRIQRPDGAAIPVEVRLQAVALASEPRRILAVSRDIRDRIAAEESLRAVAASEHARAAELNAVIRAIGEGVVVCDRDGRIILANPAAEDVFPDVDETTWAEILAELEDPDRIAPVLGRRGGPVELKVRRGDERWIEVSTWPVGAGHADGTDHQETIVMLRDVTEQRQAQAVRDTFIGVLSHELRTPVTTIYAGAKVLARPSDLPKATRNEIFADIVIESERLHRLVEDVVAMTRFGDEGGEVGAEPVLLQRLLPAVIESERPRWPGVTFSLSLPPGLPTVTADPTYVEQVVRNLLSNAAKYGGTGAAVQVGLEATPTEVEVHILDGGKGFPPEEAERLFELFFRSERTARSASGAGIGLFVCARLIRAMGGRIWAVNRPDGGAEFGFALRVMHEDG